MPTILDAFCGVGGASVGYHRAGFTVVGVDINPQKDYPFEFHQGDAIEFIREHGHKFDAIAASPPCQANTTLTKGTNKGREYPQLLPQTREAIIATGKPGIIENVAGTGPLMRHDAVLCGEMFGLRVIRHRVFEGVNQLFTPRAPEHKPHRGKVAGYRHGEWHDGPYFAVYGFGGGKGTVEQWRDAMGIDWTMVRSSIAQAIPPAYTQHLGTQLINHIEGHQS